MIWNLVFKLESKYDYLHFCGKFGIIEISVNYL